MSDIKCEVFLWYESFLWYNSSAQFLTINITLWMKEWYFKIFFTYNQKTISNTIPLWFLFLFSLFFLFLFSFFYFIIFTLLTCVYIVWTTSPVLLPFLPHFRPELVPPSMISLFALWPHIPQIKWDVFLL
jgi:hypothetical protein